MALNSYRDLEVWKNSVDLVTRIYKITTLFPHNEAYGLSAQMRRAAVSIPSNIAEGYMRGHRLEYIRFLRVAFASGAELETQLIIADKLQFISIEHSKKTSAALTSIMKMLNRLITSLAAKP